MDQPWTAAWAAHEKELRAAWAAADEYGPEGLPESYAGLLSGVIDALFPKGDAEYSEHPDPKKVATVDFGDYQGTIVLVVGQRGYQRDRHWVVSVDYGSCSGCDALKRALDLRGDARVAGLMRIALTMVQGVQLVAVSEWGGAR